MPRPKLTEQEVADMRHRILEAAVEVLHDEGPGGLSVRAIADRAGVSHMSLYSYFENQAELLAALRRQQRERMLARRAQTLARAKDEDVCEVMRQVLEHYVSFAHKNPGVHRFLWAAGARHGRSIPEHHGFHEEMRHLADLINVGIERKAFIARDPFVAALVVAGMVNGPFILYRMPGLIDDHTLEKLEKEAVMAGLLYLTGQEC